MGLVSGLIRRVEIPHEPGEWMELRRPSWRELEEASKVKTDEVFQRLRSMGGDLLRELSGVNREQVMAEAQRDPLQLYDMATVLRAGIAAWSYEAEVTPEALDSLDVLTAEWAAREILAPALPPSEEARKKGS